MVINYSKWDALELSDDSDIEVHPNVDKRSFIRAKQNQIHMERLKRRNEIKTLKYERVVNDGLIDRIDSLLSSLKSHAEQAKNSNPDNFMMQALMDSAGDPSKDLVPQPPEDVHYKEKQPATYSEMMASLVDQVKEMTGASTDGWYNAYITGVGDHKSKVQDLQKQLAEHLAQLEKEESSKITSDSIRDGFNTSSVSQKKEPPKPQKAQKEVVEVLNPNAPKTSSEPQADSEEQTSGADADIDEPQSRSEGDDDTELTPEAKDFAQVPFGQYSKLLPLISAHPDLLAERNQDALLMEAFNAQMRDDSTYARQCIHQSLLLQYCRSLGKDGIALFFKRVTTVGHNAHKVFMDDVNSTFERVRTRTAEIKKDREDNSQSTGEDAVEQIQLQAVEPGSTININVPQPNSDDEVEQKARAVFESFPPGLQRALESGSLDRVNEVLGKMSVSQAEEIVEQLGEAGMLSMEKGVIDGTTQEGQEKIKELESRAAQGQGKEGEATSRIEARLGSLGIGSMPEGGPEEFSDDDFDADKALDTMEPASSAKTG